MSAQQTSPKPIIFIDSDCLLCNRFATWVIKRDTLARYRFASLTGQTAQKSNLPKAAFSEAGSTVLWDESGMYLKSDAVLRILSGIGGIYVTAAYLRVIPRIIRDRVYDSIARRRGEVSDLDNCRLVDSKGLERFLP